MEEGFSKEEVENIRKEFPLLSQKMHGKPLVYLDSAATSQKPQIVIDCLTDFYSKEYGTVHRAVYELALKATAKYENARRTVQKFLNAASEKEIIFTRGTTDSINLVASSLGKLVLHEGDEILVGETEHHSNLVPWQMIAQEKKAILKKIPVLDSGDLDLEAFQGLLSPKTKIVAVAHIVSSLGVLNPIEFIIQEAHKHGAYVLVDGAQSAPHLPIDVQALDADFFVFSGHKTFGPTGIGVLYGKTSLLTQMPPYQGGGDMIETVSFEKTTYNTLPLKFEAGTPIIAEAIALGEALSFLMNFDRKKIAFHEKKLLKNTLKQLKCLPSVKIIGSPLYREAILSFTVDKLHALDVGSLLDLKGIAIRTGHLCAQPTLCRFKETAFLRVSFSMYNTEEEVDYFIKSLKDVIKILN